MNLQFSRRMLLAGHNFPEPVYEIVPHDNLSLTVKVYSSIASGMGYMDGKATLEGGVLRLFAETRATGSLDFDLTNWELVYTINQLRSTEIDMIRFNGKLIRKLR